MDTKRFRALLEEVSSKGVDLSKFKVHTVLDGELHGAKKSECQPVGPGKVMTLEEIMTAQASTCVCLSLDPQRGYENPLLDNLEFLAAALECAELAELVPSEDFEILDRWIKALVRLEDQRRVPDRAFKRLASKAVIDSFNAAVKEWGPVENKRLGAVLAANVALVEVWPPVPRGSWTALAQSFLDSEDYIVFGSTGKANRIKADRTILREAFDRLEVWTGGGILTSLLAEASSPMPRMRVAEDAVFAMLRRYHQEGGPREVNIMSAGWAWVIGHTGGNHEILPGEGRVLTDRVLETAAAFYRDGWEDLEELWDSATRI